MIPSDLENTLPDLEVIVKEDESNEGNQEPEMHVTTFRAINEKEKRRSTTKFERINDDSTLDTDTDTNE